MLAVPVAVKPLLKISADITVQSELTIPCGQDSGTLSVAFTVENFSHVPAQLPFLCLTDLGLNIRPVRNGRMEKLSSDGRRLVRFGLEAPAVLSTGGKTVLCMLTLSWRGRDPASVSFDRGAGHEVEALRDLRLFCITGAANFPPERSTLTISANRVRSAIAAQSGTIAPFRRLKEA